MTNDLNNPNQTHISASGERAVAIGGDVRGSVIVTGDGNTVQQGKYNVTIGRAAGLAIGDGATVNRNDEEQT